MNFSVEEENLICMVKTIGPVFQSYAPGLGLFDLAVGVAGAVILYFVVQSKIKKARKFRRDMEYGSARWGTEADIKPFVDPKFENNIILTGTEFLTMNTRPKNPANARNLNACVIGSSGSGKTTIIKLLTAEVRPTEGKVLVNNYNIGERKKSRIAYLRRTLGVVYQDFRLIKTKTVYENVAFAMRTIGAKSKAIKQRVPYVLDLVGLADKAKEKPMNLSGGEQQRVAIARALVNNPRLIIADEPTGNLDPARSLELMTLFEKINELGTTVLIVTHEKGLVDEFEKRVVMIDHGSVVSDQTGGYYQA